METTEPAMRAVSRAINRQLRARQITHDDLALRTNIDYLRLRCALTSGEVALTLSEVYRVSLALDTTLTALTAEITHSREVAP